MIQRIAALGLLVLAAACSDGLPATAPDFSTQKSVELRIELGLWENWPDMDKGVALMDLFGLGRVYVDNNDLGAYSMSAPTVVGVPGNAREFVLRGRNTGLGAGNPMSLPVDISGFAANSKILVRCGPKFPDMDRLHCKASKQP